MYRYAWRDKRYKIPCQEALGFPAGDTHYYYEADYFILSKSGAMASSALG